MPKQLALWNAPDTSDAGPVDGRLRGSNPMSGGRSAVRFPQLLKWIGNKQRFAQEIVSHFPERFGTYYEPFLGSGAVLAGLAPQRAVASDAFQPLVEIWKALKASPETLKEWYTARWNRMHEGEKVTVYEAIKANYNAQPNGADLLFLCRSCYGGVVRFRQADGYMSTPCGPHDPISPESFARRVDIWSARVRGATFHHADFQTILEYAQAGDLVYCDPPYSHTQSILYGAQSFDLPLLLATISKLKKRGVYVALSIDGTKKSGNTICSIPIPTGVFEKEILVNCGRSMLKRFQMKDKSLEDEVVADRLMLTF